MAEFRVPDMHCSGCVKSIVGAVREVDPAAVVDADLETKLVRVVSGVAAEKFRAAMEDAGFEVAAT